MFEQHVMMKNQNYGCIIGWCDCIAAISENVHFENFTAAPILLQMCPNLYYDRCELVVHVRIYFTKIDVALSEILAG